MPPCHVNDIAAELLGRIFEARLEEVMDDGGTLLELARVCKHWKDVSYRHPQLWASLYPKFVTAGRVWNSFEQLEDDMRILTMQFVDHLKRWFSRAGNLPLSLDVTVQRVPGDQLISYLVECPRWKSLCIRDLSFEFEWLWTVDLMEATKRKSDADQGRPCWPILTSFCIDTPAHATVGQQTVTSSFSLARLEAAAPKLQSLSIAVRAMNTPTIISGFHKLALANLTELTFQGIDEGRNPTFLYHLFEHAKNLVRLSLSGVWASTAHSTIVIRPAPILPIVHNKLLHLVLELSEDLLVAIMENVQLPSMRSLRLVTASSSSSRTSATIVAPRWFFPLLHRISWQHPSFWPRLRQFTFSFGVGSEPVVLELGDGDFEAFKDDPAAWALRRDYN